MNDSNTPDPMNVPMDLETTLGKIEDEEQSNMCTEEGSTAVDSFSSPSCSPTRTSSTYPFEEFNNMPTVQPLDDDDVDDDDDKDDDEDEDSMFLADDEEERDAPATTTAVRNSIFRYPLSPRNNTNDVAPSLLGATVSYEDNWDVDPSVDIMIDVANSITDREDGTTEAGLSSNNLEDPLTHYLPNLPY